MIVNRLGVGFITWAGAIDNSNTDLATPNIYSTSLEGSYMLLRTMHLHFLEHK